MTLLHQNTTDKSLQAAYGKMLSVCTIFLLIYSLLKCYSNAAENN